MVCRDVDPTGEEDQQGREKGATMENGGEAAEAAEGAEGAEGAEAREASREPDDHGSRGCLHFRKEASAAECGGTQAPLRFLVYFSQQQLSI
jgi:hypothetical protein